VRAVTCSGTDKTRSAYHQHGLVGILPSDTQSEEEIMAQILPLCAPCQSGTVIETGEAYIPTNHTFTVSR
jgi:hypothetical protein